MLSSAGVRRYNLLKVDSLPSRLSAKKPSVRPLQRSQSARNAVSNESQVCRARYLRAYSDKADSSSSSPSNPASRPEVAPNMTNLPKSMQNVSIPISPQVDLGQIQIGPDGVVVPRQRPSSTGSAQFTARKTQTTQEDMLKRMYEIDKKTRIMREENEVAKPSATPKATYKRPELVVYDYYPRKWVHSLNGVACLASVRAVVVLRDAMQVCIPVSLPC